MEISVDEKSFENIIDEIMAKRGYVTEEQMIGKTIGMEEFRKTYCGGKSPEWVRTFIFDRYPEVDMKNGGWCVNPRSSSEGKKTIIFVHPASKWMDKHFKEINWNERISSLGR